MSDQVVMVAIVGLVIFGIVALRSNRNVGLGARTKNAELRINATDPAEQAPPNKAEELNSQEDQVSLPPGSSADFPRG